MGFQFAPEEPESRFLTQDTWKGSAWAPWTQNLYTYVGNNPVNYVDPTGHTPEDVASTGDDPNSSEQTIEKRELSWDELIRKSMLLWDLQNHQPGDILSIGLSGGVGLFGSEFDLSGYSGTVSIDIVQASNGGFNIYFSLGGGSYVGTGGGAVVTLDHGVTNGPDPDQYPGLSAQLAVDGILPSVPIGFGVSKSGNDQYQTMKAGPRIGTPGVSASITTVQWTTCLFCQGDWK